VHGAQEPTGRADPLVTGLAGPAVRSRDTGQQPQGLDAAGDPQRFRHGSAAAAQMLKQRVDRGGPGLRGPVDAVTVDDDATVTVIGAHRACPVDRRRRPAPAAEDVPSDPSTEASEPDGDLGHDLCWVWRSEPWTIAGSSGPGGSSPARWLFHDRVGDDTTVDTKARVTHPPAGKRRSDATREEPMPDHGVIDP